MTHKALTCLLGILAVSAPALAGAGELVVQARVVSVDPVRTDPRFEEQCAPRPDPQRSLAELLAWDLGLGCRLIPVGEGRISGYRVSYEWDNRIMSRVMTEAPPGSHIPLRVRLN